MEKLWKHTDVANYLNVSPWTIRGKVSRREIPFLKIGQSVRFDPSEIEAWAKQGAKEPRKK
jgi:excisionase family DNA binding protein